MNGKPTISHSQTPTSKEFTGESLANRECEEVELALECAAFTLEDMGLDMPLLFCA